MDIRNINDLSNAVTQGSNTKMENGKTIEDTMKNEATRLKGLIRNNIIAYLASYTPEVYERRHSDSWLDSLEQSPVNIEIKGKLVIATIGFNPSSATHPSIIHPLDPSQAGYVPWLMEHGWEAKKLEKYLGKSIYRFTWFDGIHYVKRAVEEFKGNNPYDLIIEVYFENQYGTAERYI